MPDVSDKSRISAIGQAFRAVAVRAGARFQARLLGRLADYRRLKRLVGAKVNCALHETRV